MNATLDSAPHITRERPASSTVLDGAPQNLWYVVATRKQLTRARKVSTSLAGRPLHLNMAEDGELTAEYSDDRRSLPCKSSEGLVWSCLSPEAQHTPFDDPPKFHGPGGTPNFIEEAVLPASHGDAVYGLLDPAHSAFVHRSPIWRGSGKLKVKEKHFEPRGLGFRMLPHQPVNSDLYKIIGGRIQVAIDFYLPGLRAEYISNRRHSVLGLTALTPLDDNRTLIRQIFYWNSPVLDVIRPVARLVTRPFLQQDVRIMALRQRNLPYASRGLLVGDSDRQYVWYWKLKKAWQEAGYSSSNFVNPLKSDVLRWKS